jgi:hypothetical protein
MIFDPKDCIDVSTYNILRPIFESLLVDDHKKLEDYGSVWFNFF